MPTFTYTARDSSSQLRRGVEEAVSPAALVGVLRSRGWLVTEVKPGKPVSKLSLNPLTYLPPRSLDIEMSLQQLAIMIRSGLTLLSALRTVAEQSRRWRMRKVWETVADAIQRGSSLADAMALHKCFSPIVVQLVRVGEQTGTLEPVLARASAALERRRLLWTHMITAMAYPAVVCVAAVGVATYMILGVIPKLQKLLVSLGRKLPAITQSLLDVSDFVQNYLPAILGVFVGLILIYTMLYLSTRGRLALDRFALRLPLFGYLFRLSATTQFAYALGTLLRSGVTLVESLRTVAGLHGNHYAGSIVLMARDAVVRGGNLADQLLVPSVYMPMLPRMVAVGEAAGTLDDVLDEVARFHESQLQLAIRRLSVLIEPVIIAVVGGIVGFVYIAFFVALFSVAGGAR